MGFPNGELLDPAADMGVEVHFICKLLPSPFELFHNEIAIRLYRTCDQSRNGRKEKERNYILEFLGGGRFGAMVTLFSMEIDLKIFFNLPRKGKYEIICPEKLN